MEVRPASAPDARAMAELQIRCWRAAYQGFLAPEVLAGLSVARREAALAQALEAGTGFVAGDLAGFCVADPASGEVVAAYVDPARWNQGVGRSVLTPALEALGDGAHLWTFQRNAQGRAFFARSGFRLQRDQRVDEDTGVVQVLMRR
jgi:GNAT superfamily N-acetyltransferase